MSLQAIGILGCILLVAVCVLIVYVDHEASKRWRLPPASKDTQRTPDWRSYWRIR